MYIPISNYKLNRTLQLNLVTNSVLLFSGFVLMGACITWFELAMYCVCLIAFILGIVVLVLAILLKRQVGGASSTARGKKGGAAGKKPPVKKAGPKGTKQGWN